MSGQILHERSLPPQKTAQQLQEQERAKTVPHSRPAAWQVQKHKLANHPSPYVRSVLEGSRAADLQECAARADEMLAAWTESTGGFGTESTKWPSPEEMTAEWVDSEVDRRRTIREQAERTQILVELRFAAYEAVYQAIERIGVRFIEHLAKDLEDLVGRARSAVDLLGPHVSTSIEAIDADKADVWKSLSGMAKQYRAIRDVQDDLYSCDFAEDADLHACGYGQNRRAQDDDAFLYAHRNIARVAAKWLGYTMNDQGRTVQMPGEVPWPKDHTEKLVWFIRNDSGIWCPTPDQIDECLRTPTERPITTNKSGNGFQASAALTHDLGKPHLLIQR